MENSTVLPSDLLFQNLDKSDLEILTESLQEIPFCSHLATVEIEQLTKIGRQERVEADHTLFHEGDQADRLYVILDGKVRITKRDDAGHAGHEANLAELGKGNFFGELALIDGGARLAGAVTIERCDFFILDREPFLVFLAHSPAILGSLFSGISEKIRDANQKIFREVLLQARQEVERHRVIAEMVAGVAHEINTPIGLVNTAASLLSEGLTDKAIESMAKGDEEIRITLQDFKEAADLIQSNIARSARLIESFKNLSVNQVTDVRGEVDLPAVVGEVVNLFRIRARLSGIEVEIRNKVPAGSPPWIGYSGYFSQIMLNLLQNVERYAYKTGGGKVEVEIGLANGESGQERPGASAGFTVAVRDFGAGIPAENIPKIFDAFFTTGRDRGGSGLGMAIVHNLVTGPLGGTIIIESDVGKGTTVRIHLPRTVPDALVREALAPEALAPKTLVSAAAA